MYNYKWWLHWTMYKADSMAYNFGEENFGHVNFAQM